MIVIANFSSDKTSEFELKVPAEVISKWKLKDGSYVLIDKLYSESKTYFTVKNGEGVARVKIKPSESFIYEVN
ncbi:hypothetical protein D3C86_1949220 [compost metagenome]